MVCIGAEEWCMERPKKPTFCSIGILVNGQLIGAKKPQNEKLRTYFGKLGFYFQSEDMKIEISTETIALSRGSRTSTLFWSDTARSINQRQVFSRLDSGLPSTRDYITNPEICDINQNLESSS